jgi:hypothetical protein
MYTTEVCGVKTLRLIASTGKEAAEKAADAESVVGDDAGGTENASAGVRPPPLRHPS